MKLVVKKPRVIIKFVFSKTLQQLETFEMLSVIRSCSVAELVRNVSLL